MRPVSFPYLQYKGFPCPIVTVAIRGRLGWSQVLAYVDSGASYSIFSPKVAEESELAYEQGQVVSVMVGDGSSIPVYLHHLPLRIGSYELRATIGFSPRLGVGFNLLGRRDIFSRFDVTFSDARRLLIFTPAKPTRH